MSKNITPLDMAIAAIGSQTKLAQIIGMKQQTVSLWVKKNQPIPAEHILKIEEASGIARRVLRPDLFGNS